MRQTDRDTRAVEGHRSVTGAQTVIALAARAVEPVACRQRATGSYRVARP